MVSCKNCSAQNSLDSAFCRRCGATIPDADLQAAKEKVEAAVADGYRVFSAGRTDDAMRVAEEAVASNPLSTAALSLKAMCHERMGQIAEALECHDRVLEIDPDSIIDKIKSNDLRNLLVARNTAAAVPDRRMAIVGAIAAFVFVASIGILFAKTAGQAPEKSVAMGTPHEEIQQASGAHLTSPSAPGTSNQTPATGSNPANGAGSGAPNNSQNPPANAAATNPPQQKVDLPSYSNPSSGPKLPAPNGGATLLAGNPLSPFVLNPNQIPKVNTNPEHATNGPTNPPVPVGDPPPTEMSNGASQQPSRESPGIMEIKIISRNGKPTADAGTEPGISANGVEALVRTARNQYQLGNYQAAATSYERALRAGADPATGNQRLAQCYEKLGHNGEAVSAYNRAITALQNALNSGNGDKDRISAALDSCKQAVKVLGG